MASSSEKDLGEPTIKGDTHLEYVSDFVPEDNPLPWYQQKNLRALYLMMPFLFLGSTTLGYDGSLLNGLQTMPTWQECMCF